MLTSERLLDSVSDEYFLQVLLGIDVIGVQLDGFPQVVNGLVEISVIGKSVA